MSDTAVGATVDPAAAPCSRWRLRLYVAGQSPKSMAALMNLKQLCDLYLAGDYGIEVVDLLDHPHLAEVDQVIAIPTLVRMRPRPPCKVVGDLSDHERVVTVLDMPTP